MDAQLKVSTLAAWPVEADELVAAATAEDFRAMVRLRDGWLDDSNRFTERGEGLFQARVGARLVGLCGLNRDPFTTAAEVGRLRHLYVCPDYRRRGVGRALVLGILERAKLHFRKVRLRTDRAAANAFYLALGFHVTPGDRDATHEIDLTA